MGNFETSVYESGSWTDDEAADEWKLRISVHDSAIATVDYRPSECASGRFYLGFQPRDYFEDPAASDPVDLPAEAACFSVWASTVAGADVPAEELMAMMAAEDVVEPEDVFVEETVIRLLARLGLPLPAWLEG
ncbi:hypothetical protein SAMN04487914_104159 [Arthrobacter sp. ok909]|uniref:hypothetical protein n=1 Tax=Arthrobacter sp. ok909 TaxID=1761746 RepID=UPI00088A22A2|nr:hypothetical protein [Arthrobacter sp. ok909]SDP16146.1 hypothetical protein SAMN04487914_104159 [Arthrobacter sp. ok909]